jgi:hypothetical protein
VKTFILRTKESVLTKKTRKNKKKQHLSRCRRSKLHFDETKSVPSILELVFLQSETIMKSETK